MYTDQSPRFSEQDWPLAASLGSEKTTNWKLLNGEMLWLVHFCLSAGADSLREEANRFRGDFAGTRKLDIRSALDPGDPQTRIMIPLASASNWFEVIDAAAS
jgi:hypothetical protein